MSEDYNIGRPHVNKIYAEQSNNIVNQYTILSDLIILVTILQKWNAFV